MARPVNAEPFLPRPFGADNASLSQYNTAMLQALLSELQAHATRLNNALEKDGTEGMTGPLTLKSYTVLGLPAAAAHTSALVYVSNEAGGATVAFSDGTNWRRVQDRNVVS